MGTVLIGCSGWSYPDWREPVYGNSPEREWLGLYAQRFSTVEVNASFYRLPTRRAAQTWAERSPDGFVFAVKASRYLTHVRRLQGVRDGAARLLERIQPLADAGKLGVLLWQFPDTFHRDDERLSAALAQLPDIRNAFEFRHPSWFCRPVRQMLTGAGAALVVADHPDRPAPVHAPTAGWAYIRFHHGTRGRRGGYSLGELEPWARRITRWSRHGDVYAYFNNDWEAFAVRDATRLAKLLRR